MTSHGSDGHPTVGSPSDLSVRGHPSSISLHTSPPKGSGSSRQSHSAGSEQVDDQVITGGRVSRSPQITEIAVTTAVATVANVKYM